MAFKSFILLLAKIIGLGRETFIFCSLKLFYSIYSNYVNLHIPQMGIHKINILNKIKYFQKFNQKVKKKIIPIE